MDSDHACVWIAAYIDSVNEKKCQQFIIYVLPRVGGCSSRSVGACSWEGRPLISRKAQLSELFLISVFLLYIIISGFVLFLFVTWRQRSDRLGSNIKLFT